MDAINICKPSKRKIVLVGDYSEWQKHVKISLMLRLKGFMGNIEHNGFRYENDLNYNEGPYYIELDCLNIKPFF